MEKFKDKYDYIEYKLEHYIYDRFHYEALKEELSNLKEERHLKGIKFDSVGGGSTWNKSDVTGDTAILIVEREKELKLKLKHKRADMRRMEGALNLLDDLELEVIRRFFFKRQQWWQIVRALPESEATLKRRKRSAVEKLATCFFGSDVDNVSK